MTVELSIAKKFNFCAARRFFRPDWSEEKNGEVFGHYAIGHYGFGQNFTLWVEVTGTPNSETGMIVPLEVIKSRISETVLPKFDHQFFSMSDSSPIPNQLPITEQICATILDKCSDALISDSYRVSNCTLHDGDDYGVCASPTRPLTTRFRVEIIALPQALVLKDHVEHLIYPCHLSVEFSFDDSNSPLLNPEAHLAWTTQIQAQLDVFSEHVHMMAYPAYARLRYPTLESYAVAWWPRLLSFGLVSSIELTSFEGQSCRYDGGAAITVALNVPVYASHCLEDPSLSTLENNQKFGKCASHHGHRFLFQLQTTHLVSDLTKSFTPQILADYLTVRSEFDAINYRSITHESRLLGTNFGTCESILLALNERMTDRIPVSQLRVFETENNLISLRNISQL